MAPRLLLCGDVLGRVNQLFKRVSSVSLSVSFQGFLFIIIHWRRCNESIECVLFQVNKSAGPFDALLCVGQFFPDSPEQLDEFMAYIEGGSHIPLPTYFVGDYGVSAPKILLAASKDPANRGFKMDGLRVCDNLYWLKGSGKFNLLGILPILKLLCFLHSISLLISKLLRRKHSC